MVGLEIYYDLLFLSVFTWNACTFSLTNQALGRVAKPFRIWMSALSAAVIFTGILFLPLRMLVKGVLWLMETCGAVLVLFPVRRMGGVWKVLEAYWIRSVLWACSVLAFYKGALVISKERAGISVLFLGEVLMATLCYFFFRRREEKGNGKEGMATLEAEGCSIDIPTFVDTGNSLWEPISGKPVCVLYGCMAKELWKEDALFRVIPYRSVGVEKGIMKAYLVNRIYLDFGGPVKCVENVWVAKAPEEIAKERGSDCLILHPQILLEKQKRGNRQKGEQKHDNATDIAMEAWTALEKTRNRNSAKAGRRALLHRRGRRPATAAGAWEGDPDAVSIGNGRKGRGQSDPD